VQQGLRGTKYREPIFGRETMERVKFGLTSRVSNFFGAIFGAVIPLVFAATAPAQSTNLAVTVRHAPSLNGNGRIEGSLQQLLGENRADFIQCL